MDVDVDAGALDVLAEQTGIIGILEGGFEMLEGFVMKFAAQVVVGNTRTRAVTTYRDAFDHGMWVEAQDVAILAGTGF